MHYGKQHSHYNKMLENNEGKKMVSIPLDEAANNLTNFLPQGKPFPMCI